MYARNNIFKYYQLRYTIHESYIDQGQILEH